jgi:hypothetical protein
VIGERPDAADGHRLQVQQRQPAAEGVGRDGLRSARQHDGLAGAERQVDRPDDAQALGPVPAHERRLPRPFREDRRPAAVAEHDGAGGIVGDADGVEPGDRIPSPGDADHLARLLVDGQPGVRVGRGAQVGKPATDHGLRLDPPPLHVHDRDRPRPPVRDQQPRPAVDQQQRLGLPRRLRARLAQPDDQREQRRRETSWPSNRPHRGRPPRFA